MQWRGLGRSSYSCRSGAARRRDADGITRPGRGRQQEHWCKEQPARHPAQHESHSSLEDNEDDERTRWTAWRRTMEYVRA